MIQSRGLLQDDARSDQIEDRVVTAAAVGGEGVRGRRGNFKVAPRQSKCQ